MIQRIFAIDLSGFHLPNLLPLKFKERLPFCIVRFSYS